MLARPVKMSATALVVSPAVREAWGELPPWKVVNPVGNIGKLFLLRAYPKGAESEISVVA
jgi:hypothetical protein